MERFSKVRLEDITINFDKSRVPLSSSERVNLEKKYRYYGAQGIIDYVDKYIFDGEYLLVAEDGENLKSQKANICNLVSGKFWVNNHAHILQASKGNDIKYIYYLLNLTDFRPYITGSAQPKLTKENLNSIELLVHDLPTQQKIASVLSALDAKIELNNRINAELEAMAKTLYDYWFVQFDFPNAEGKPYKTSGGKMVWNEELKREIPEGWEVESLSSIANITTGKLDSNAEVIGGEFPFFTCASEPSTIDFFSYDDEVILIAGNNASGNFHLNRYKGRFNAYQRTYIVTAKEKWYLDYLFQVLKTETKLLKSQGKGSQTKFLTLGMLTEIKILANNREIIFNFFGKTNRLYEKQVNLKKQNQYLTTLRDWLLPMLVNGQVTVGSISQTEAEKPAVAQPETLFIADNKKGFAKQVLGGKIVSLFQNDPHFSSIKFQKIQYLAEHVAEVDLNWNYYYQAAGPYDNVYMHTITDKLKTANWFEKRDSKYVPLDKQEQIDRYYHGFFQPVAPRLDHLFSLLANMTDIDAEIIATLYAVWNNRLILKQPISEELLIDDFYNWSDRKLLYTQEQLQKGLQWMHTNNIVPNGFGKEMKRAKEKSRWSV